MPLIGSLNLPSDKSISQRYAILAAMAEGTTRIRNYSQADDCQSALECAAQLGVRVERTPGVVQLSSPGWQALPKPSQSLDAGNSGTTLRLMTGLLAGLPFQTEIGGDGSLNRRPMERIVTPLTKMGAHIQAEPDQRPPLRVEGNPLRAIEYQLPVASAQVKSCLLIAGLTASGTTKVIEIETTRDHTERALPFFGVPVERDGLSISVTGPQNLSPVSMDVPADLSSALYFVLAALLVPGSDLQLERVGNNPTRNTMLRLLLEGGASIEKTSAGEANAEPTVDLRVRYSPGIVDTFPSELRAPEVSQLIDEIPALAILGTQLSKGFTVRDAGELRVKESDRITGIVQNLAALGIHSKEFEDGFEIPPGQKLRGGLVRSQNDHRLAMAFAIAGLLSNGPVEIDRPECASVSFPGFFETLRRLAQ